MFASKTPQSSRRRRKEERERGSASLGVSSSKGVMMGWSLRLFIILSRSEKKTCGQFKIRNKSEGVGGLGKKGVARKTLKDNQWSPSKSMSVTRLFKKELGI